MPIQLIPPERFLEAQEELRGQLRDSAPEPINADATVELLEGKPRPLTWRGQEYRMRRLSYVEGLRLQRATATMERMKKSPPRSEAEIDEVIDFLAGLLDLFHSFLDPRPDVNPFFDASPAEVGSLLGFSYACLMNQAGRSDPQTGGRPSPLM